MNQNHNNSECIPEEDLVVRDEIAFKDKIPFNGLAMQDCQYIANSGYKNASDAIWVKFTYYMPYQNGIKKGLCKAYYENNQLTYEVAYKKGKRNGFYKEWYQDGKLKQEGIYEEGKKEGVWKSWFENGCQESELMFENDEKIAIKWWYNNYQLNSERSKQGLFEDTETKIVSRGWFENSQLKFEEKFIKKNEQTIIKQWNSNGQLIKKDVRGSKGNTFLQEREYYENGLLKTEENYIWGTKIERHIPAGEKIAKELTLSIKIKNGVFKKWNSNGRLEYEMTYIKDKKDGVHKRWHKNGKLMFEHNYKEDKKDGVHKDFNPDGSLKLDKIFKLGQNLVIKTMYENYYKKETFTGKYDRNIEYFGNDGILLPKSEWPKPKTNFHDYNDDNGFNDTHYNDQLDMDQQSPEFWDSL